MSATMCIVRMMKYYSSISGIPAVVFGSYLIHYLDIQSRPSASSVLALLNAKFAMLNDERKEQLVAIRTCKCSYEGLSTKA